MGLLYEYSRPDHIQHQVLATTLEPDVIAESSTSTSATIPTDNETASASTITRRDIVLMCVIVMVTFFSVMMITLTTFAFILILQNPQVLENPDPYAATEALIEPYQEAYALQFFYMTVVFSLALLSGVGFIGLRIKGQWHSLGLYLLDRKRIAYAIGIGLIAGLSISGGNLMAASVSGTLDALRDRINTLLIDVPGIVIGIGLLVIIIILPLAEELFFRGVLYTWVRNRRRPLTAMMITGIVYALLNLNPIGFIPNFVLGVGLAMVYERTQSVWGAYFAHSTFNLITICLYLSVIFFT